MTRFPCLAVVVALVACSTSSLTNAEYRDAASIIGSSVATPDRGGSIGVIADSLTVARGDLPKGFVLDSSGAVVGDRGAVTYRYNVMCLGTWTFSACSPPASSAVVQASWEGTIERTFTGPVSRQGVFRLDNLNSPMGIVTATTALVSQTATFANPQRVYHLTDTQDLMMFADMATQDMMGGELTTTLTLELDDERYSIEADLTINSDHTATLVLDAEHTYNVDLDTGDLR